MLFNAKSYILKMPSWYWKFFDRNSEINTGEHKKAFKIVIENWRRHSHRLCLHSASIFLPHRPSAINFITHNGNVHYSRLYFCTIHSIYSNLYRPRCMPMRRNNSDKCLAHIRNLRHSLSCGYSNLKILPPWTEGRKQWCRNHFAWSAL